MMSPKPPHFPKPKLERLPRRKYVTIAAGFCSGDGIVLCADTQENVADYIKRKQPKLEIRPIYIPASNAAPCAVFAGAGDGSLVDYLIDKLWAAMESKKNLEQMIEAAENAIIRQYQRLVPIYPAGMPEVQLLLGIWAPPREIELLKITGPIVNRHVDLESI